MIHYYFIFKIIQNTLNDRNSSLRYSKYIHMYFNFFKYLLHTYLVVSLLQGKKKCSRRMKELVMESNENEIIVSLINVMKKLRF